MTRLSSRLDRLENDSGRYCTLGEILDAIELDDRGDPRPQLGPIDPRLVAALAQIAFQRAPEGNMEAAPE